MNPDISQAHGRGGEVDAPGRALLERDRELSRLGALLDAVSTGEAGVLVIEGPTGVGKTQLLAVGDMIARNRGTRVLSARASELERDYPFAVVRQWLEPVLFASSSAERARLMEGAAGLAAPVFEIDAAEKPMVLESILHGLYWLLVNLAAQEPVLLSLDDAQWADGSSLRFMNFLASRLGGLGIGVLIACRPPELHEEGTLLARLSADPHAELLRPAGLSEQAASIVLAQATGHDPDASFVRAAHAATGGNPFYLWELGRALAHAGLPPTDAATDRISSVRPQTLSRVILARLTPAARALAQGIAVLEEPADVSLSGGVASLNDAEARYGADELARAGLTIDRRPLEFGHAIVRGAVLSSLSAGQRAALHARAAELLQSRGAPPERVAVHLIATEPAGREETVATLRLAARQAIARGAPEAAVPALRRALDEPPEPSTGIAVRRELGRAKLLARDPTAIEDLELALGRSDEPAMRAQIASELSDALLYAGRRDEGVALMHTALEEIGELDPDFSLRLEAMLAGLTALDVRFAAIVFPELPRLHALAERGGKAARALQLVLALLTAHAGENTENVLPLIERGLDDGRFIAEETADPVVLVYALDALIFTDQLEQARTLANAMLADAAARGSVAGFIAGSAHRGLASLRAGALAEAEADTRRALELAQQHQLGLAIPFTASYLAATLRERGQLAEAA